MPILGYADALGSISIFVSNIFVLPRKMWEESYSFLKRFYKKSFICNLTLTDYFNKRFKTLFIKISTLIIFINER